MSRCLQRSAAPLRSIKALMRFRDPDQELPLRPSVHRRRPVPHSEVGPQDLFVFDKRHDERSDGVLGVGHSGEGFWRESPPKHASCEGFEVRKVRLGLPVGTEDLLFDAVPQQLLPLCVVAVQDRPCPDQRGCRYYESARLHEPHPVEMGLRVGIHSRHQFVSGQR